MFVLCFPQKKKEIDRRRALLRSRGGGIPMVGLYIYIYIYTHIDV